MVKKGDMMDIDDIIDILAIDLLGVIPEDEAIVISSNRGEPVALDMNSQAGQAYRNIARRITGEDIPLISLEADEGILGKLKKFFGFNE
jgi:septum site-determining protein MinD